MNQTWWTVLTAVAGLGMAACLYVMHGTGRGIPGLKALDGGFQSLDMRFHYGSDQAFAWTAWAAPEDRCCAAFGLSILPLSPAF